MLATNVFFRIIPRSELSQPTYQKELVNFLFTALGQYSDPIEDIYSCLKYIMDDSKGGEVIVATNSQSELCGVVFLTKTRMESFVPQYLLVYIAVSEKARGQGIGQGLLEYIKKHINAPIALHVEHQNPAKKLYEKLGFTNKYTEMRWYP
ncbi:MAG TPA: GNAT family N-acetyltransferase [Bacteriovoracaceae bacterium]|nr:GNAT family N-acetyltransferase [Bacteriovoracaceae bacterium]